MNRQARRKLEKESKKNKGGALLAAQALSRDELDQALRNFGGLIGSTNYSTSRSVMVTNYRDERVTVVASVKIFPAPDPAEAEVVILINPKATSEELRVMAQGLLESATPFRVLHTTKVPILGALVLRLDDLTAEETIALEDQESRRT